MNKRMKKKMKHTRTIEVRDFTLQEAWDKVAQHLVKKYPNTAMYFIEEKISFESGPLIVTTTEHGTILKSSETKEEIIKEHYVKLEPEDVTFYCQSCTGEITAQQDVDNDGECDTCFQGKNEMWAKEAAHEAKEYRDMKL